jgi:uncharacterized protein with von Willebrand factor type A (vWA) domain
VPADSLVRHVVVFGRVLREAGLEVGPGRIADALRGLDTVELARQEDVYWTLRQTIVSKVEDLEAFDRAFEAWFLRSLLKPPRHEDERLPPPDGARRKPGVPGPGPEVAGGEVEVGGASEEEYLRTRDFAAMTKEEFAQARRLIARIAVERPRRRTRRLRPDPKGDVLDVRLLARHSLATGGEPMRREYRSRSTAPRKLVLLLDVSASMESYSRALLLYLHAARGSGRRVETFVFGTRLTRITRELATRNPDAALEAATKTVVDWSGGTRIGASLRDYNEEWGRRALTRGAVVVILSDGWERGVPGLLEREMARLARQAFAVVWVNPLKADAAYEPLTRGMKAALPSIDRFVSGHDVASLQALGVVLRGLGRRHAA